MGTLFGFINYGEENEVKSCVCWRNLKMQLKKARDTNDGQGDC